MTDHHQDQEKTSPLAQKIKSLQLKWQQFRERAPLLSRLALLGSSLFLLGVGFIISLLLLVRLGAFGRMPSKADLRDIRNHTASEVYSADGVLLGKYYIENRTNIAYDDLSPDLVNALIATEDARFLKHSGIDLRAWVRVFIRTVLLQDESGGGGSTISQQLAKNLYKRQRYRLLSIPINKIQEMYIARRLEKVYTKDELINLYLNTVPFGSNIYGVEVAAKQFFQTNAKDIKTEEAAVLIGMLKANTYYNPARNPERSKGRRNVVLRQMNKYNYLSKATSDSLQQLPLEVNYTRESNNEGLATYFREHLRQELVEQLKEYSKPDGSPYNLYTDGLKIHTTLHARLQGYAEEAVQGHMAKLQTEFDKHWKGRKPWGNESALMREVKKSKRYKSLQEKGLSQEEIMEEFEKKQRITIFSWKGDQTKEMSPLDSVKYYYSLLNAGFLVMDPANGHIKAWVGGTDHEYFKYDHVKSRRQVGSTFKPIVYASALQNGFKPCDYYYNRLVTYTDYDDWQPQNADGKYGGLYSMQGALSKSVNSVAVDLIVRSGVDSVQQLAQRMGISSDIPKVPSIALGTVEASLYDMIQVYGTLANRGKRPQPLYLTKVEDSKGELIFEKESRPANFPQALSRQNADLMRQMMRGVVDSGTARKLRYQYKLYGNMAGKTGTTQSHADGWFIGFTSRLVAGAWVGGEYPSVRFRTLRQGQGGYTALPIWGRFMQKVDKDKELRALTRQSFPTTSLAVAEALDCAPYLEELPLLAEEEIDSFDEALESLISVFRKNKGKQDPNINRSPSDVGQRQRQQAQQKRQEQERIRKRNAKVKKKRERKKKRKEAWKRLFKKN